MAIALLPAPNRAARRRRAKAERRASAYANRCYRKRAESPSEVLTRLAGEVTGKKAEPAKREANPVPQGPLVTEDIIKEHGYYEGELP